MSDDELVQRVLHVKSVEAGIGEESGPNLFIEKPDGSGVKVPIDEEAYQNIENEFILTEDPDEYPE